jgi:hypothetical protein
VSGDQFPAHARGCKAQIGGSVRKPPIVGPPRALDYGRYWLIDGPARSADGSNWRSRIAVAGGEHGIGLDGVAAYLFGEH